MLKRRGCRLAGLTRTHKAGCKAAPKQRPPGGPKNKTAQSRSQITIRIALTHSTPLPFPAQFACALFVLDIAGDGAKSVPDRQSQAKVAAKKTRKRPGGLACEGAGRSCMDGASRGLAFGAGNLRITRLRSFGPPLYHLLDSVCRGSFASFHTFCSSLAMFFFRRSDR